MTEQLTFFVSDFPTLPPKKANKKKHNEHEHIPTVNKREDKSNTS